ncbi:hypothetical protein GNI_174750 [Gregarina niphandrodes]|uniref:Uncharacterized protein n=1 Tax=Gregarina niphandrodes TaxID=110365 RepID=A0A023AXM0_GRENI|nr:hypothetical protein GNI_174750 [Gregarina niphandrodes]EZG43382.1 hypothetical protein GNI_174750 [Gregarina niphandrodes]|eukprot:XP_011133387.1 hypothetical protein GNI_174750 [Gregarina niphandrodes]
MTSPGEEICGSLATQCLVWDRRIECDRGCPPPMPGCVRLGFGNADNVTLRLFLAVALQAVDQLMKSQGTLFSPEQIHVVRHDIHPMVRLDFSNAARYVDRKKASDEAARVSMAQAVLVKVAKNGHLTPCDPIGPLKTFMASMNELWEALFKTYKGIEPSGDYKSFYWKGICRPVLGLGDGLVEAASAEKSLCPRCEPGPVFSLPVWSSVMELSLSAKSPDLRDFVPADHRVPMCEWIVLASDGGEYTPYGEWPPRDCKDGIWQKEMCAMRVRVKAEARRQGVQWSRYPWPSTWKPEQLDSPVTLRTFQECIQWDLDERAAFWRVANLGDLLKSYRLSSEVVTQLEKDALELIDTAQNIDPCKHGRGWYIGSYPQAYVVLEPTDGGRTSRLCLATGPVCLTAQNKEEARRRHTKFWDQVRNDAGCKT